jgi:hypothetical protein
MNNNDILKTHIRLRKAEGYFSEINGTMNNNDILKTHIRFT